MTTFENDEYVYDALRAGASGFLLKRAPSEEIIQTIRATMVGEALVFPRAIRALAENYGPGPENVVPRPSSPNASSRCCVWWPRGSPTPRSRSSCTSASRP